MISFSRLMIMITVLVACPFALALERQVKTVFDGGIIVIKPVPQEDYLELEDLDGRLVANLAATSLPSLLKILDVFKVTSYQEVHEIVSQLNDNYARCGSRSYWSPSQKRCLLKHDF